MIRIRVYEPTAVAEEREQRPNPARSGHEMELVAEVYAADRMHALCLGDKLMGDWEYRTITFHPHRSGVLPVDPGEVLFINDARPVVVVAEYVGLREMS